MTRIQEEIAATNLEIISPHFDDAVYSCWQLIQPNSRVTTLFGGYPADEQPSEWDISTGFGNAREAIETRVQENQIALDGTGANILNLEYLDTVFREDDELTDTELFEDLRQILDPRAVILAPLGFSFTYEHPDHILTREAIKRFMKLGRKVVFYADIPYAVSADQTHNWPYKIPNDTVEAILGSTAAVVPRRLSEGVSRSKIEAVRSYASQFARNDDLAGGVLSDPRTYDWECIIVPK